MVNVVHYLPEVNLFIVGNISRNKRAVKGHQRICVFFDQSNEQDRSEKKFIDIF